MQITRLGGAVVFGAALALVTAAPGYAQAYHPAAGWDVQDTDSTGARTPALASSASSTTVELVGKGTPAPPHYATSAETTDLGLPVAAGDVVSVDYELVDGASPAAGAVRLFIYDHADANTFTEAPTQFVAVPDDGTTQGTLEIVVSFDGAIGTAGLVYDSSNGNASGSVVFSDLTVAGQLVLFQAPPEPDPEPTEEPPAPEPDPEPTEEPPAPVPGQGGEEPGLPVTGSPLPILVATGAGLAGLGGGALALFRRRRNPTFVA